MRLSLRFNSVFVVLVAIFAHLTGHAHAESYVCFARGILQVESAIDDPQSPVELVTPGDQFATIEGLPVLGFRLDIAAQRYLVRPSEDGQSEYTAAVWKTSSDIQAFVSRVQHGEFDPQNVTVTISVASMEYVEVDRFLTRAEMLALGYTLAPDDSPKEPVTQYNVIMFGNCRVEP